MAYYDTFMRLGGSPAEMIRNHLQEVVNADFEVASTYYPDVEEEVGFGTLEFKHIDARVGSLVDSKTGQRVRDDYKKLIFKDIEYTPTIGTRYRIDNNIWLSISPDNIKTNTSSVYMRRCNNTINTQDEYGNIHREPCYIDYTVSETLPNRRNHIDVSNAKILVRCQRNEWTKNITINDRFVFGTSPYKLREFHDFDRDHTFDDSTVGMVSFFADFDEKAPDDNIPLGIANFKEFTYDIIVGDVISGSIGDNGVLTPSITLNSQTISSNFIFTSTNEDVVIIDNEGNYTLIDDGDAEIYISPSINPSIYTTIDVVVSDVFDVEYKNVIEPYNTHIKLNKTQNYSVYEYKNNMIQDTAFTISESGMPTKNYRITKSDNGFSITNLKTSENNLLKVVCTNNNTLEDIVIFIELGGLF